MLKNFSSPLTVPLIFLSWYYYLNTLDIIFYDDHKLWLFSLRNITQLLFLPSLSSNNLHTSSGLFLFVLSDRPTDHSSYTHKTCKTIALSILIVMRLYRAEEGKKIRNDYRGRALNLINYFILKKFASRAKITNITTVILRGRLEMWRIYSPVIHILDLNCTVFGCCSTWQLFIWIV